MATYKPFVFVIQDVWEVVECQIFALYLTLENWYATHRFTPVCMLYIAWKYLRNVHFSSKKVKKLFSLLMLLQTFGKPLTLYLNPLSANHEYISGMTPWSIWTAVKWYTKLCNLVYPVLRNCITKSNSRYFF